LIAWLAGVKFLGWLLVETAEIRQTRKNAVSLSNETTNFAPKGGSER
jgi:hypothetical protein